MCKNEYTYVLSFSVYTCIFYEVLYLYLIQFIIYHQIHLYNYRTLENNVPSLPLTAIHAEQYCFIVLPTERVMTIGTILYRIYITYFTASEDKCIYIYAILLVYICLFYEVVYVYLTQFIFLP